MKPTALVVGGGGVLGDAVVRRLLGDGFAVKVLVHTSAVRMAEGASPVPGDVRDEESVRAAVAGCDVVHVSLRGGPRPHDYDEVEHLGTARVARLAADSGVSHLTYLSHMLAAPDAAAASLRAKAAAEKAARNAGLPVTVLRATYMMETLPRHVRGSRATVLGRQPHRFHLLAAADLAAMVSAALQSGEVAGRVLDVRGPEPYQLSEALRRYCQVLRPEATVTRRPLWLMRALDSTVLQRQLGDTLNLMTAMQKKGEVGDPRPARTLLPWPQITLTDWLAAQLR